MYQLRRARTAIANCIGIVISANNVAWAVEGNRRPDPADLRRLGIDPASFARIQNV